MFPCGHVFYSLQSSPTSSPLQVLGALLPDAATTSAFSWTELHQTERIDSFESFVADASLAPLILGLRHHIELDERSHNSWNGAGGYAYTVQTPELRELVAKAFDCDDDRARTLAHNFIESACDIHIAQSTDVYTTLQHALQVKAVHAAVVTIASWLSINEHTLQTHVAEFLEPWMQPYTTIHSMTSVWLALVPHLNTSAFGGEIGDVDEGALRAGLELAVDLVADSYLQVLTPGPQDPLPDGTFGPEPGTSLA